MSPARAYAASLLVAIAFAAIAFGARGGSELERTSLTLALTVLACAALCIVVLLRGPRPGRVHGLGALACFVLLAAITALSISWSIAPELTFVLFGSE